MHNQFAHQTGDRYAEQSEVHVPSALRQSAHKSHVIAGNTAGGPPVPHAHRAHPTAHAHLAHRAMDVPPVLNANPARISVHSLSALRHPVNVLKHLKQVHKEECKV